MYKEVKHLCISIIKPTLNWLYSMLCMNIQIIEHHCVEIHSDAKLESIYVIYNFWYMIFITSNSYIYYYIRKKVTWLILPVVICLSQRLSHASLSINHFYWWNCERLIKSVIVYLMVLGLVPTTWITVVT